MASPLNYNALAQFLLGQNALVRRASSDDGGFLEAKRRMLGMKDAVQEGIGLAHPIIPQPVPGTSANLVPGARPIPTEPDFAKWGVKSFAPRKLGEGTHVQIFRPDGNTGAHIGYQDRGPYVTIDGLSGGRRGGVRGEATRAVKAVIEWALANGKPVIATQAGGARPYWSGAMGFKKYNDTDYIFDANQAAKIKSGEITTTAWPHPRGYGDMFRELYGGLLGEK